MLALDTYGNVSNSYSGSKALTWSGAGKNGAKGAGEGKSDRRGDESHGCRGKTGPEHGASATVCCVGARDPFGGSLVPLASPAPETTMSA